MKLKHCALVAIAALLLGACNSAGEPLPTHTPVPTAQPTSTPLPTATEMPLPTATEMPPPPTATEPPLPTATEPPPPPAATATPSVPAFLEVRPDDWVHGPANAEVTIIEYSDYQ